MIIYRSREDGGVHLLVLVAVVIPVVPPARRDHIVEVGVSEDDPRVLPHGSPHVELA